MNINKQKLKQARPHLGDKGTTQINKSPTRVSKSSAILEFYGQVDKVNALLNIIINKTTKKYADEKSASITKFIENLSLIIKINSSIIASIFCNELKITSQNLEFIEKLAYELETNYKATDFIWIYKNEIASYLNLARAEARLMEHLYYKSVKNNNTTPKNTTIINITFNDDYIQAILNRESTILFHYAIMWEQFINQSNHSNTGQYTK